eukprot:CAMPEP_0170481448 /NCGR_PEP_ID=MMETSP0208-20121228/1891_1 /TAXON_ID=197538 /ORGANISM="Strombidium inclinatum, Strain S3" /LENGTH=187 /DNA_ID=CAMNT_0010754151 /DNA_START=417 /DNA_END=981 /DNA_ORIENTATION=+
MVCCLEGNSYFYTGILEQARGHYRSHSVLHPDNNNIPVRQHAARGQRHDGQALKLIELGGGHTEELKTLNRQIAHVEKVEDDLLKKEVKIEKEISHESWGEDSPSEQHTIHIPPLIPHIDDKPVKEKFHEITDHLMHGLKSLKHKLFNLRHHHGGGGHHGGLFSSWFGDEDEEPSHHVHFLDSHHHE